MAVPRDEPVGMPDLDQIAITPANASERHDAVTNDAYRCPLRRGVVHALVLPRDAKNRVLPHPERTGYVTELNGELQEPRAHRASILVVVLGLGAGPIQKSDRGGLLARQRHAGRQNLADPHDSARTE